MKKQEALSIIVKCMGKLKTHPSSPSEYSYKVHPNASTSADELKRLISDTVGVDVECITLKYKGKIVPDELSLLCDGKSESIRLLAYISGSEQESKKVVKAAPSPAVENEDDASDTTNTTNIKCKGFERRCNFYGDRETEGYCSLCYKRITRKRITRKMEVQKIAPIPVDEVDADADAGEESIIIKRTQTDVTRCFVCNKKIGLLGFLCKCDYKYCALHRYPDQHDCKFDFKKHSHKKLDEQLIAESVSQNKISKI